jgi:hypothetical protein
MKEVLKKLIPARLRSLRYCFQDRAVVLESYWRAYETKIGLNDISSYKPVVDASVGIIKDPPCVHQYYVYACESMRVPYKLVDIFASNWMDNIEASGCAAFLVAPSLFTSAWRNMYDERLRVIVHLGKIIYPSYDELWMYESKRRMNYWLRSNSFLCPGTYIFYSYSEALDFARSAELPIVSKTDAGYGAQGVRIFKKRSEVVKHVKKCFSKGVVTKTRGTRNIEKGSVFFQEYLPDVTEWRMVRIGESYFAHQKLKKGEFHSGSGRKGWFVPPRELLDFVRQLTDSGGFTSMNIDVFETVDNRFLVNELQTLFGSKRPYQMVLNGQPGR